VVVLLEHDLGTEVNVNTLARAVIYNPANRRALATLLKKRAASRNRPWGPVLIRRDAFGNRGVLRILVATDIMMLYYLVHSPIAYRFPSETF
jgi:hypothetical protein